MSRTTRRRLTGSVLAGLACVALLVVIASHGVPGNPIVTQARADDPEPQLTDAQLAATLLARIGLSPEVLAAVGASDSQATGVVLAAHVYLLSYPDDVTDADAALGSARAEQARLRALVQSGQASEQDLSDLTSANAALAQAMTDVGTTIAVARNQIMNPLTQGQRDAIEVIRANRAMYGDAMPVAVAADIWSDADWVASRAALASVDQAVSYGVQPDASAAGIVDDTMDRTAVAAAESGIANNLAGITSAWDAALAGL